jgi:hypothetical protein
VVKNINRSAHLNKTPQHERETLSRTPGRIRKTEVKSAIAAVQEMGLSVCQVAFDKNGFPIVTTVDIGDNLQTPLDEQSEAQKLFEDWKREKDIEGAGG